jgi:hypothetical protein
MFSVTFRVLAGKVEGKRTPGKAEPRCEANIKTNVKEVG